MTTLATCRDLNTGYTALHISALNGHSAIVRALLSYHGQNFDVSSFFTVKDRRGCLPLHLAAWNGHVDSVSALLDVDPSCQSVNALNNAKETPLHLAAQHGHFRVANLLLKHHGDPTVRNARGETALDLAARFGRTSVTRLLISHCPSLILSAANDSDLPSGPAPGSPVSSTSCTCSPCSPLHLAARNGHLEIVEFLLGIILKLRDNFSQDSGFDINWITEEGSALHVAALFGRIPVVKYLLRKGISVHNRDWQGRTVVEVLEEHQNQRSMDLTQLMQNKDAWAECRYLIEEKIAQRTSSRSAPIGKTLASVVNGSSSNKKSKRGSSLNQTNNNEMSKYQNLQEENPNRDLAGSPVWQKIPNSAAQKIVERSTRSKSAMDSKSPIDINAEQFRPLSVQALPNGMEEERGVNEAFEESESLEQESVSSISITATPSVRDACSLSPSAVSTVSSASTFTSENFHNENYKPGTVTPTKPPRRSKRRDQDPNVFCNYQGRIDKLRDTFCLRDIICQFD